MTVEATTPSAVVVLAAGAGTRMKSTKQKTLHEIGGRTLLGHALHAAAGINPDHLVTVVGHQREQVSPVVEKISNELDREVVQAMPCPAGFPRFRILKAPSSSPTVTCHF